MQSLRQTPRLALGQSVARSVQQAVTAVFPQQPRYAPLSAAGHQTGGEFVLERRPAASP
jgi:hypothetical protein